MSVRVSRRTRRRLLLLGLLLLLPALVLSGKVGLMLWHDRQGRDALAEERYADARDHFAANRVLNLVERWVAPYDEGIALYGLDDPGLAVAAFEDALVVVPPDEECRVRVNLAVAHEAVGDAYAAASPADLAAARDEWTSGRQVLAAGGCLVPPEVVPADDSSGGEADEETDPESVADARTSAPNGTRRREVRAARVVDERLADKLTDVPPTDDEQPDDATPSPDPSPTPDPDPDTDPDDQLSQRNDRGERLRSQTERERDLVDPPDGGSDGTGEPGDAPTVSY